MHNTESLIHKHYLLLLIYYLSVRCATCMEQSVTIIATNLRYCNINLYCFSKHFYKLCIDLIYSLFYFNVFFYFFTLLKGGGPLPVPYPSPHSPPLPSSFSLPSYTSSVRSRLPLIQLWSLGAL